MSFAICKEHTTTKRYCGEVSWGWYYIAIIIISLLKKWERGDITVLLFGFFALTVSEYFFILTGVETFTRTSLLGVMPLWLPFLWGYAFVAIKRAIKILEQE